MSVTARLAGGGTEPLEIGIRAEPLLPEEGGDGPGPVEWTMVAPGVARAPLDPTVDWLLELDTARGWARPMQLAAGTTAVRLTVFPTAPLRGTASFPAGERRPAELLASFGPTPLSGARAGEASASPAGQVSCPLVDGRWECRLPVGSLDLRLAVEGFVPHYLWDVELRRGEVRRLSATVPFERGASLAGWVSAVGGDPGGATVSLVPEHALPLAGERERTLTRRVSTAPDGFFQVAGVPPGAYVLRVEKDGLAPVVSRPLTVLAERETRLTELLELSPPVSFRLRITPPVDAAGERWRLRIRPTSSRLLAAAVERPADASGRLTEELPRGPYELEVEDSDGSRWIRREIEIGPATAELEIEVPLLAVTGRVEARDEGVEGELVLSGVEGFRRAELDSGLYRLEPEEGYESPRGRWKPETREIRFRTDGEGVFSGYLPHAGQWRVRFRPAGVSEVLEAGSVEVPSGGSDPVELEIALPAGRIAGEVVDRSGNPIASARVIARSPGGRRLAEATSGGEEGTSGGGGFVIDHLAPGTYRLQAEAGVRQSAERELFLPEDGDLPGVRLVLERREEVDGLLVDEAGRPVAGARISVLSASGVEQQATAQSGPDGRFTLYRRPDGPAPTLVVVAPGLATAIRRVLPTPNAGGPLLVALERRGGTLVLAMEADGEPITTIMHDDGAVPLGRLLSALGSRVGADPERGFVLAGMEPGTYLACNSAGACAEGFLPPLGELELDPAAAGVAGDDWKTGGRP